MAALLLVPVLLPSMLCIAPGRTTLQDPIGPSVSARTGPIELADTKESSVLQMYPEPIYRAVVAQVRRELDPELRSMRTPPDDISASARFGINVRIDGQERPWAFDPDHDGGKRLWVDLDGDTDLDDETPIEFTTAGDDEVAVLEHTFTGKAGDESVEFAITLRFKVGRLDIPGMTESEEVLFLSEQQVRRGELHVGNTDIAFALVGTGGVFDSEYDEVYFDLDADGTFDFEDRSTTERHAVKEGAVTIGERSFSFAVDRYGRTLTLTPLAEKLPERIVLEPGAPFPALSGKGLDGTSIDVAKLSGKFVLVDFWELGCAPCVAELPNLKRLYERFKDRGFEIVGVSGDGEREAEFREFVAKQELPWPQILEPREGGTNLTKFRVSAFPTTYLVGPDGTLLMENLRGEELLAVLEQMVR